jgi:beta-glucanase (GH16 family)
VKLALIISSLILSLGNPGEEVVFFEDFSDKTLNEAHWNYELGDGCPNLCGWGNNERQVYTRSNIEIKNGHLIIKATKNGSLYESGRITTKDKIEFRYGVVEVRAQLPEGKGLWPAIWMLGNDIDSLKWPACGEIDIMEYAGKEPGYIHTSLHTPSSFGNPYNTRKTFVDGIEEGFHIYKVNWTQDRIEFYIDEGLVYSFSPKLKDNTNWPFNKPFYVILNMAIGGNFGGPEVDDSIFPKEFKIDYVKIYKP